MVDDPTYRRCVQALWALVGAARAGDADQATRAAAAAAQAVAAAAAGESHLLLHEQAGSVHLNGRQVGFAVEAFAAVQGLAALLQERGVGELLFDAGTEAAALLAWASCWTDGRAPAADPEAELAAAGAAGVHAARREAGAPPPGLAREPRPPKADSRLRAVFLQHHLIAAFGAVELVPRAVAHAVLEGVVDRLLAVDGGLEPLQQLQRDPARLQRGLQVAVLSVLLARVAGWPDAQLADLGAAALLHDLGAVLDPARPAAAAVEWFVARGDEPLWLRCALVARQWRQVRAGSPAELCGDGLAATAFVRLAAAACDLAAAGVAPAALGAAVAAGPAARELPAEFDGLVAAALAAGC